MLQHRDDTRNTWTYFKLNYLHSLSFEYTMRKLSSKILLLDIPDKEHSCFHAAERTVRKGKKRLLYFQEEHFSTRVGFLMAVS